jgi:Putative transposase of IS4/5 family (DUF4096)
MDVDRWTGVARGDLSNGEWAVLAPLLPAQPVQGRRWRDHRQVINAICWVKRTGSPWWDLPERYGPWKTPYQRFRRWAADTRQLIPLLDQVRVATPGPGRPRMRPNSLTGDRAYSSRANRKALRGKHIITTIRGPAIRSPTGCAKAATAVGHPRSTRPYTSAVTRSTSSKCSTGSAPYPTALT